MTPAIALDESTARQIVLVQAFDQNEGPLWTAEDRAWASRLAGQTAGVEATPAHFFAERARHALQRLQPREPTIARWLAQRWWRPRWAIVAVLAAWIIGALLDSIGSSQSINLLAPPVWAVIVWNLLVLAGLLVPAVAPGGRRFIGVRRWLGTALLPPIATAAAGAGAAALRHAQATWLQHAASLNLARTAVLMHLAAAALAAGLVGGMYLRGLVLDYRASWQSTFLSADTVQPTLRLLLSPASALTGIEVPTSATLEAMRIPPGMPQASASASAAPWIHLYAAMLALFVIAPRLLLALTATLRAAGLSRRFPLPLSGVYFEQLQQRRRGGVAHVQVLPHGAAPGAQAVLGLRALLAQVLGDDVQLRVAPAVAYGDEEAKASTAGGAASADCSLRIALFDLAATPEAETQGRFVQAWRDAAPNQPLLIVVDETAFKRRFANLPGRLAQRREAWHVFAAQLGVDALCVGLDQPEAAGTTSVLKRMLAA